MTTPARMLLASAACTLIASCGGGDARTASFDGPSNIEPVALAHQDGPRAAPPMAGLPPAPPPPAMRQNAPAPAVAIAPGPVTRARFNPDALGAVQMAATLQRFGDAVADEKSCPWGEIACDMTYTASLNVKLHGSVGRVINEDGKAYFDAEDVVQLPSVPAPLSIFIQSGTASKDVLHVTLEDRLGNRLYALPPLAPGASTAFGWTRTDDAGGAPFRVRLQVPAGPGDHAVDYVVLPALDTDWRAGLDRASPRMQ